MHEHLGNRLALLAGLLAVTGCGSGDQSAPAAPPSTVTTSPATLADELRKIREAVADAELEPATRSRTAVERELRDEQVRPAAAFAVVHERAGAAGVESRESGPTEAEGSADEDLVRGVHPPDEVGQRVRVMVDGPSAEHELVLRGRLEGQAPDIDPLVYLTDCDPSELSAGQFLHVEITGSRDYDLLAQATRDAVYLRGKGEVTFNDIDTPEAYNTDQLANLFLAAEEWRKAAAAVAKAVEAELAPKLERAGGVTVGVLRLWWGETKGPERCSDPEGFWQAALTEPDQIRTWFNPNQAKKGSLPQQIRETFFYREPGRMEVQVVPVEVLEDLKAKRKAHSG